MGRGFGGSVPRVRATPTDVVYVYTDGTVYYYSAGYSLGFAPGFDL